MLYACVCVCVCTWRQDKSVKCFMHVNHHTIIIIAAYLNNYRKEFTPYHARLYDTCERFCLLCSLPSPPLPSPPLPSPPPPLPSPSLPPPLPSPLPPPLPPTEPVQITNTIPGNQNIEGRSPFSQNVEFTGRDSQDITITWHRDGIPLPASEFSISYPSPTTGRTRVEFPAIMRSHAGVYRVVIESQLGRDHLPTSVTYDEISFQVTVEGESSWIVACCSAFRSYYGSIMEFTCMVKVVTHTLLCGIAFWWHFSVTV